MGKNLVPENKVTKTFVGRDAKIMSCEIKTNYSFIKRATSLLYSFELTN